MDALDRRLQDIRDIGYEANFRGSSIYYTNGEKELPSTLIVGCSTKDWDKFIKDEKLKLKVPSK